MNRLLRFGSRRKVESGRKQQANKKPFRHIAPSIEITFVRANVWQNAMLTVSIEKQTYPHLLRLADLLRPCGPYVISRLPIEFEKIPGIGLTGIPGEANDNCYNRYRR